MILIPPNSVVGTLRESARVASHWVWSAGVAVQADRAPDHGGQRPRCTRNATSNCNSAPVHPTACGLNQLIPVSSSRSHSDMV